MSKPTTISPAAILEDDVLIQQAIAGQAECFKILMDRHLSKVRRCIGAMVHGASDKEDLIQNVLLKVWRHLATFRSESSFGTWIIRIAVNEVLQSYRRERTRPMCQPVRDLDAFTSAADSPHVALARIEARQTIRRAIAKLPETYRQVLILRELEQLTERETAQSLRSSIPAVKTRVFRARVMLRQLIQQSRECGR
jgi:RNA polymerase sigma-70 factor (ECF subfamily)